MTVKELASRRIECDTGSVIGTAIREARLAKRLSLADVAKAVGLSRSAVSRIELGHTSSADSMALVAAAVGLEIVARKARKVAG